VATFYHFFTFTPKAAHSCVICTGTACYVKGAETLLSSVRQSAAELNAQTGEIGTFVSVDTARCLGVCGLAPLVVIDGEMCGTIAPDQAVARMKGWRRDGSR